MQSGNNCIAWTIPVAKSGDFVVLRVDASLQRVASVFLAIVAGSDREGVFAEHLEHHRVESIEVVLRSLGRRGEHPLAGRFLLHGLVQALLENHRASC